MIQIAIIADDLTGAADTGAQFCPRVERVVLASHEVLETSSSDFRAAVLSGYTSSRAMDPLKAGERMRKVAQKLQDLRPELVYKKIDSCLRGHIGTEVEALLDETGHPVSFIAPAFPEMGRTTVHDVHRVHGTPVADTEMGMDPVAPIRESRASVLLMGQCGLRVAHVDLRILERSDEDVEHEVSARIHAGARHLVFDASTQDHLDRVAALGIRQGALLVGSAGLAEGVARAVFGNTWSLSSFRRTQPRAGRHLMVCGSRSERTRSQVRALLAVHPYRWMRVPWDALARPERRGELWALAHELTQELRRGDVVVTVESAAVEGAHPSPEPDAAEAIVSGLGSLVGSAVKADRPRGLFLTGGDTAEAVLRVLGAGVIRLRGEILKGVIAGVVQSGPMAGLSVVTKAGAFAADDALIRVREFWSPRPNHTPPSSTEGGADEGEGA